MVSFQGAHLVGDNSGNKFPTSIKLVSLDLRSNQAGTITTIQAGGPAVFQFIVSPDGSQALYYNAPDERASNVNLPFTPQVALITLATGHVTWLPTIARATGGDIVNVAWRPGSETLAVSLNRPPGQGANTWLLDLSADTATPIHSPSYSIVMAWAPDNGPLIVSSGYQSSAGSGPYTLWALMCAHGDTCSTAVLTKQAMTFDFLGFVRNP